MSSRIVVHYGEIGTKGANRPVFEKSLERNLRTALTGLGGLRLERVDQRFIVHIDAGFLEEAKNRVARVFGVVWYAEVASAELSYPEILRTSLDVMKGCRPGSSFRVSARRPNKGFQMTSQELAVKLGEDVMQKLSLSVDLSNPDCTLYVDVVSGQALVYREHLKGLGGLPVGVSGQVLHLLSGGIDSPVAGWLMMKRGCSPTHLHFYLAPGPQAVLESKMVELVRILGTFGGDPHIVLVPFAPYQLATVDLPSEFEPVVFRRFMRIVAEKLASRMGQLALSTGDNLAQVASQTLQNLVCIDSGSSMTTLRPLLGYDKEEIVQLAKLVGTYETSIREYKDCCSIVSRHPRTRMKVKDVDEASRFFGFDALAEKCLEMSHLVTLGADGAHLTPLAPILEKSEVQSRITG